MAPGPLAQVLRQLPTFDDPNFLSGDIPFADSGIYRISEDRALVQSVDFFTPVVNDPGNFGRIAAANSLSDVYAAGGVPLTALNVVGFPSCALGPEIPAAILIGGSEKVLEAGAVIVGGHTVEDNEPKYGMAVTGLVDPRRMLTTRGCRPGDRLVLTKPLGTGILTTALKGQVLTEGDISEAVEGMIALNRTASRVMMESGATACTDITGFGLLGHGLEMAEASAVRLVLEASALPLYPHTKEMAAQGLIPGGSRRNRDHYLPQVENADALPPEVVDILADPQTSGGLLIAIPEDKAQAFLGVLRDAGAKGWLVGCVEEGLAGRMRVE